MLRDRHVVELRNQVERPPAADAGRAEFGRFPNARLVGRQDGSAGHPASLPGAGEVDRLQCPVLPFDLAQQPPFDPLGLTGDEAAAREAAAAASGGKKKGKGKGKAKW